MSQIIAFGARPGSDTRWASPRDVVGEVEPPVGADEDLLPYLGFTMIEFAGMLGRFPDLFDQANEAQFAVQVTWKTCPGVVGVF